PQWSATIGFQTQTVARSRFIPSSRCTQREERTLSANADFGVSNPRKSSSRSRSRYKSIVAAERTMSDQSWEEQFKKFLQKTGKDFRRTGEDIRAEAQRLLDSAMDPDKQQKIRNRLNELGMWARKAAQGVA